MPNLEYLLRASRAVARTRRDLRQAKILLVSAEQAFKHATHRLEETVGFLVIAAEEQEANAKEE